MSITEYGKAFCLRRSFSVALTVDDFKLVVDADLEVEHYEQLDQRLGRAGAEDVDYDGHFGAYIYFAVCDEDDTPEKLAELEQIIADYVSAAKNRSV